ncbi:MAG: hypothetical protein MUF76_15425, partial [Hydrogenophaga sp.]|nr:hypothetical protein [Hydrogenophaga sp.]
MSFFTSAQKTVCATLLGFGLATLSPLVSASNYYFYVENKTNSRIVKLEVSQDKKDWGFFDIGRGIGKGKSSKLVWDESTEDEDCEQWIRARFA